MAKQIGGIYPKMGYEGASYDKLKGQIRVEYHVCEDADPKLKKAGSLNYLVGGTKATGTITVVAGSSLVEAEKVTLNDGVNSPVDFEFDTDSSVAAGAWPVVVTGLTRMQVRDALVAAINSASMIASNLYMSAAAGVGDGDIDLTAEFNGTYANQTVTHTVADAGFSVTGMAGGTLESTASLIANMNQAVKDAEGIV